LSGPAGGITSSSLLAQQVWVKSINQKGGLNGHPVKLFVYDDGGDPARHRAQVQEAIEQRRIIAFLGNTEVLTGQGSVEYITTKRIPVVGSGDGSATWFYESPMYFPQATVGMHYYFGALASIAQQVVPTGKTKLATFTCVEVEDCATADRVWSENAEDMGFTLVYRARASLGQPDYTAECLAARNAGADVAMIGIDTNSFSRIAVSCARQAYRPLYASLGSIVDDRFKDDPNFDGLVAAHPVFPYFQSGTPATDEFQRAMRAYGGGAPHTSAATTGWVAAKLLEKAAANLPEPPTTEALLKGLWSLRSDDLGGLTQPLTFVENQRTPPKWCMFNFTIKNRTWLSTDGFELRCRNNGPK
jgi:branched-chain amino acid transport system substrate-binding protein